MRLTENTKVVMKDAMGGTGGLQTAGNGVNMAKYAKCRAILLIACDDQAVGGGAVTLKQGTTASCSTALAYSEYWKNEDVLAADALTKVTAASCAAGIRNKTAMYVFEIRADMLDSDTFKSENQYVRLDLANITTATESHSLIYELYEPRYVRGAENMPTAW
jgi:hypothetical protein